MGSEGERPVLPRPFGDAMKDLDGCSPCCKKQKPDPPLLQPSKMPEYPEPMIKPTQGSLPSSKAGFLVSFLVDARGGTIHVLKLGEWFNSTRVVLGNLLDTYQEKDTTEWWSKIFDIQKSYGSGGGTFLTGWFVTDFLGIKTGQLGDLPSGINLVSLTITDGDIEEESLLLAGFTGYTVGNEYRQLEQNLP